MTKYQAVGIGNAVVDVISQTDDGFLSRMGIEKGIMQLIEQDRAEHLYDNMQNRTQMAGGSVANTIAGLGALGLGTAFIGRVSDDALGHDYAREMADVGVDFVNAPASDGELPTSRSMIFVSPDGERSMNTYLGISTELGPDDVDETVAGGAGLLFLEGYLFDKDKGKAAFLAAARACREAGGMAGITLSDPFCVDRHRADFRKLVTELDYVIGNEHEWCALYETEDLGAALEQAAAESGLIVCTRSGHDVVIVRGEETVTAPVEEITPVDTTGAGDQFAAGFLYGLATGASLQVAGRMGCIAAAEVITHYGARPDTDVRTLFKAEGLI
ncbi:5-dehydro-2-deoxygluconokinase [Roseovarius sp. THAF9]|uniref:adenosine kinase n=1 Tax=Roseovarius sp. THAF9 TaxID=2587847 RepID=UPI001268EA82|nr:adenosine kinase [Roseovarius sp. THAF9]QFT91310.1 5-dehydro-2-deoxygluconokinase [Roseovarius sp. THAF9]